MSGRDAHDPAGVRHEVFTVSRLLPAGAAEVYAAFADPIRGRWMRMPGRTLLAEHEFRTGGGELARSRFEIAGEEAEVVESRTRYLALVPDRLLVWLHEARVDDVLQWIALVTVDLHDEGTETRLDWTEQVTLLPSGPDAETALLHLRGATALRLNGLPGALRT